MYFNSALARYFPNEELNPTKSEKITFLKVQTAKIFCNAVFYSMCETFLVMTH